MLRREFVASTLATAAAWAKPSLRLSTSSVQFSSLSIEEACQRISSLGCGAIDLWNREFGCPHMDDAKTRLGANGLKALLSRHKLAPYAFTCYKVDFRDYAPTFGKAGFQVAVRESKYGVFPNLTAEMRTFLESMKPDLELAEKYNLRIAIENHGKALLNSLDSFKAFADLNQNKRLGLAIAPYHLQALNEKVEDVIAAAGNQLLFFYAWQNGKDLLQLPGHGPADFAPWLAALRKSRYRWYVNPFMHGHPGPDEMTVALGKAVKYLKQVDSAL